jgi:spore germination cell wall hydrolase CwlJ-like protein
VSALIPIQRKKPKGVRFASFGFALCIFALVPNETGYQDIASLLARQPGVGERWQKRISGAAATIQLATYSFGRPIGTSAPESASYRLASLDRSGMDITGSLPRNSVLQTPPRYQPSDFPRVDRTLKGDRLVVASPPVTEPETGRPDETLPPPEDPATSNSSVMGAKTAAAPAPSFALLDPELQAAMNAPPLPQYSSSVSSKHGVSSSPEAHPLDDPKNSPGALQVELPPSRDTFKIKTASLFFGNTSLGGSLESIERWQPGEEPTIVMPDPDMKAAASLRPPSEDIAGETESGESIAPKGEVNADNQISKTPAERLGLTDEKSRAKAEKCLAEVVYFEARGEAVRGQIAVAQVVMNRAFSGKYPNDVCGVVYQNKHRHMACQFTFACDNYADVIREPDMWDRAKKIAKAMLDGQVWLPEVGKSTHYHAYYVRPSWVNEMTKLYKFGVHTFYRPKKWGDGSDAPSWGTPAQTAALSEQLAAEAKSEAEMYPNSVRR